MDIKSLKIALIPILSLIIISTFSETLANTYSGQLSKSIEQNTQITRALLKFLAVTLVYAVSSELYGFILAKSLQKVYIYSLRDSLERYIRLDFLAFKEMGVGKILATVERRSLSTGELVGAIINHLLPIPFFLVFLSYRIFLDLKLAILLWIFAFVGIYLWITVLVTNYRSKLRKETNDRSNDLYNLSSEILCNYETIRAFNNEEYEIRRYEKKSHELLKPAIKLWQGLYFLNMMQKLILFFMDATVLIFLVSKNRISIEVLTQYIFHSGSIKRKFSNLGSLYGTFRLAMTNINSSYVLPNNIELEAGALESFEDKIVFDNVTLYHDEELIFKNLNFVISKNDKIAIVGSNGSGKTTFIRILLGFYEYRGSIKIDAVELREIKKSALRNFISFVPQDSSLMDETVKENIIYGSNKNDLEMISVSKKYGVHNSILRLKDSYMTIIGERGKNLSGGEKQKIALVRAALRDRDIYILDEPTANIDSMSEIKIFKTLLSSANRKTVFVIVHNFDLLPYSDKVLHFNNSTATLYDSHAEFLKNYKNQIDFYKQGILSTESLSKTSFME